MFIEFTTDGPEDASTRHFVNCDAIVRADAKPNGLLILAMISGEVLTLNGADAQRALQAIEPPQA